jgi:hypothetical protein
MVESRGFVWKYDFQGDIDSETFAAIVQGYDVAITYDDDKTILKR